MRVFFAIVVALLALAVFGPALGPSAEAKKKAPAMTEEQLAIATLNAYRKSQGVHEVGWDPGLSKMALSFVTACAKAGSCDHNTGGSFPQRAAQFGYANVYGAENLMVGGTTLDEAFTWWKASSMHNGNMLMKQVTRAGFARLPAKGAAYWVLIVTSDPAQ